MRLGGTGTLANTCTILTVGKKFIGLATNLEIRCYRCTYIPPQMATMVEATEKNAELSEAHSL